MTQINSTFNSNLKDFSRVVFEQMQNFSLEARNLDHQITCGVSSGIDPSQISTELSMFLSNIEIAKNVAEGVINCYKQLTSMQL